MKPVAKTLSGNPDSVEFCPSSAYPNIFACGTYTLDESGTNRLGELYLFSTESGDGLSMNEVQCQSTAGIFDIKWSPVTLESESPVRIGQAGADGNVVVYSLQRKDENCQPLKLQSSELFLKEDVVVKCGESMCLSLDWNPFSGPSNPEIATSMSDGTLRTVDVGTGDGSILDSWSGHAFEVWTTAYDRWKPQVLYSGADDCHFCGWDLRQDLHSPVFRDKRSHTMGVCCIQSHPLVENLICTGSYDEQIRIWDSRMMARPLQCGQVAAGGGVWRLKWHPAEPNLLLAACMHDGFKIVDVSIGAGSLTALGKIVCHYEGHGSLAYGADWQRKTDGSSQANTVATCSFYDRSLQLWDIDLN